MEVIYTLIPGMIFIGLVLVGILIWAVKHGQYEDLEGDSQRILMDDDDPLIPDDRHPRPTRPDLHGPDADDARD